MKRYGEHRFPGKLFVVEGIDGSGKSTQLMLLHQWLQAEGYGTVFSEWNSSPLVRDTTKRGKKKKSLTPSTFCLIHATDFADRLENEIVPALRAGFVVLTDRYIYSLIARAVVRGIEPAWVRNVYRFALIPDAVFYLKIGVEELIPRVVFSTGFDYWESGMDLHPSEDMYESFQKYQTALLSQFENLAEEYQFKVINASQDIPEVFEDLREGISDVLAEGEPPSVEAIGTQGRREAQTSPSPAPADTNAGGN